jgi:hypothetical protein
VDDERGAGADDHVGVSGTAAGDFEPPVARKRRVLTRVHVIAPERAEHLETAGSDPQRGAGRVHGSFELRPGPHRDAAARHSQPERLPAPIHEQATRRRLYEGCISRAHDELAFALQRHATAIRREYHARAGRHLERRSGRELDGTRG